MKIRILYFILIFLSVSFSLFSNSKEYLLRYKYKANQKLVYKGNLIVNHPQGRRQMNMELNYNVLKIYNDGKSAKILMKININRGGQIMKKHAVYIVNNLGATIKKVSGNFDMDIMNALPKKKIPVGYKWKYKSKAKVFGVSVDMVKKCVLEKVKTFQNRLCAFIRIKSDSKVLVNGINMLVKSNSIVYLDLERGIFLESKTKYNYYRFVNGSLQKILTSSGFLKLIPG